MARVRAPESRREATRRRSLAAVTSILQQLSTPATPVSDEELQAIRAELDREPHERQGMLTFAPSATTSS